MSRALNTTTGQVVDGDLVQILGDGFRDWRAKQLTVVGAWEINPTSERIAAIQTALYNAPEAVAAREAAKAAELDAAKSLAKASLATGGDSYWLLIRAFAGVALEQINALRTKLSMAPITQTQFSDAIKAKITSLTNGTATP